MFSIIVLVIVTSMFYHTNGDYNLLTSKQTVSGLYNANVYVVGEDVEPGNYKICTGLAPINYQISNYSKQDVEIYKTEGVSYTQPVIRDGKLKRLDCELIQLNVGEVIEAENKDAGLVNYVLKENKDSSHI